MTLDTIKLAHLIKDWIEAHPILSDHFIVEDRRMKQYGPNPEDTTSADSHTSRASHFISYACPNRSNLWAIVFINNKGTEGYFDRNILIAEDPRFFEKLEAELIKHHDHACNGHSALGNCKELLGEEIKPKRR